MIQSRFFHALILALGTLVVAYSTLLGSMRHILSYQGDREETVYLFIEKGSALGQVAYQAQALGIVHKPWHFKLAVRWARLDRSLYAGEYEIGAKYSLYDVLSGIKDKNVHQRRLSIPEGLSVAEVIPILRASFGLVDDIVDMPAEGSLLPDTYFYERGDSATTVLRRMKAAMSETILNAWEMRAVGLPFDSIEEALVLASIVEKETGIAEERPLVAAVFVNRLKKRMRLQSDPTVIYGIMQGKPLDRPISRADLRAHTPYNTYRINGLPPTPIANPGVDSIMAVLNPASVQYLYFVADGTGGHAFATTLSEHNRNVARWRKIERQSR